MGRVFVSDGEHRQIVFPRTLLRHSEYAERNRQCSGHCQQHNAPPVRHMPKSRKQDHQSGQREICVATVQEVAGIKCIQVQRQENWKHENERAKQQSALDTNRFLLRKIIPRPSPDPNAGPDENSYGATHPQSRQHNFTQREGFNQRWGPRSPWPNWPNHDFQIEPESRRPGQ